MENIQTFFQIAPAQTIFQLSCIAFEFVTCGYALIGGVCAINKKHYKVALFGAWLMTFWLSWTTIVEFINALASQFAIWQYVLSAVAFAVVTISSSLIRLVLIAASKQTFLPRQSLSQFEHGIKI